MSERTLGRLVATVGELRTMIDLATVGSPADGYYDEMLIRVDEDGIETPAGSTTSTLATYCSVDASYFDVLEAADGEFTAVFDIVETVEWLEWLGDPGAMVDVRFQGSPEREVAAAMELSDGDVTARVPCYRDQALLEQITYELPSRFTEEERFLLEDGREAPTRVETTAAAMERVADAVALDPNVDHHPFVVRDGELRLRIQHSSGTRASGRLEGRLVEGPDVSNYYDDGFARVASVVSGEVTVQTGRVEPLVVVDDATHYTLRYVVLPVVW
jgi:hypothetical protein